MALVLEPAVRRKTDGPMYRPAVGGSMIYRNIGKGSPRKPAKLGLRVRLGAVDKAASGAEWVGRGRLSGCPECPAVIPTYRTATVSRRERVMLKPNLRYQSVECKWAPRVHV